MRPSCELDLKTSETKVCRSSLDSASRYNSHYSTCISVNYPIEQYVVHVHDSIIFMMVVNFFFIMSSNSFKLSNFHCRGLQDNFKR